MFETAVAEIQANIDADAEVVNRGKVIDHLLDLRSAAEENQELVGRVDSILSDVPGKTMVATEWWTEQLSQLELASKFLVLV